jgi:hypothetical protein
VRPGSVSVKSMRNPRRWSLRLALLLALGLTRSAVLAGTPDRSGEEFFEAEVRPLLVERCVRCHDEKTSKAGLKLTSRASLLAGGDSGPAAVEGKPDESLLIEAVGYQSVPQMPPKGKLSEGEIATLTRWVARGLPWPEARPEGPTGAAAAPSPSGRITEEQRRFWSFQPVRAIEPPAVRDAAWPRSRIDRFILAALETRGLAPAPPADRRTLLRRATLDLTGLPPAPEEVDAFLEDRTPGAFARVVDHLLASPHYGERWARHWLDVVRYTDSSDARGIGGEMDIPASWRYRDWVVAAFNRDLPYDQFVRDQVAGDVPPPGAAAAANADGIIATGLLAIGNWGGGDADKEKLLTDIADDQVDVVGRAFLGLTIACARCHDHKFDPIPTEDYYGLAGIFFSTHILPNVGPKTNGPPMLRIPLASPPGAFAHGAQEGGVPGSPHEGVHDVKVHIRGRYDRLGALVPRHFPTVLAGEDQEPITYGSGRRELAEWLTRPDHPLTARVMVNRIWQHHFGEGIVRTPSNFGRLGERPTHPELLDDLARRFVEGGWSIKQMHRTILLSSTYQQSSEATAESLRQDPDNRLFGRMSRRRLESEEIRDGLLAVAGRLDRSGGGPAYRDFATPRRTLYLMTIRSDRSGFGPLFDAADPTAMVDRRTASTVAPQALFLLNHPFVLGGARSLAHRLLAEVPGDDRARIRRAYALLYGRPPADEEIAIGLATLAGARQAGEPIEAAWEAYGQVLLCTNEFFYVD